MSKITDCKPIMNGEAHVVTLDDGREATAWSDKIDGGILMQKFANQEDVEFVFKAYNSKGKSGLNIVAFANPEQGIPTRQEKSMYGVEEPAVKQEPVLSLKDEIIVAEVILKGAVDLANANSQITGAGDEALGRYLSMAVNELTGAFKLALHNVSNL